MQINNSKTQRNKPILSIRSSRTTKTLLQISILVGQENYGRVNEAYNHNDQMLVHAPEDVRCCYGGHDVAAEYANEDQEPGKFCTPSKHGAQEE